MWTTFAKLTILAGLSLFIQSGLASAQIFQWTDPRGVIHFTDNPQSISDSIRSLPTFTIRRDLVTKNNPPAETLPLFPPWRIRTQQTSQIPLQIKLKQLSRRMLHRR